jgi:hypothetical protein
MLIPGALLGSCFEQDPGAPNIRTLEVEYGKAGMHRILSGQHKRAGWRPWAGGTFYISNQRKGIIDQFFADADRNERSKST